MNRSVAWLSLGLVGLTCVAFAPLFGAEFVDADDAAYIINNPYVNSGLTRAGLWAVLVRQYHGVWIPLTYGSHALDVTLFGLDAPKHHAVSVAFHIGSALLLFSTLRAFRFSNLEAFMAAAIFAVHPLRAEPVGWLAERKEVLCTFFSLVTLRAYASYAAGPSMARWSLVALSFAAAILSKSMAMTLPFALLLCDVWPLARHRTTKWTTLVLEKIPLLGLSVVAGLVIVSAQRELGALHSLDHTPLLDRLRQVPVVYVENLLRTFWPVDLSFQYPREHPSALVAGLCALGLAGLLAGAIAVRARLPSLAFGLLFFLGVMFPTTGIVQIGDQMTADRYTYLPHVGLIPALVAAASTLMAPLRPLVVHLAAGLSIITLTFLTFLQSTTWRNSDALFEHALEVNPHNSWIRVSMGLLRQKQGDLKSAEEHLRQAAVERPDYAFGRAALGAVLVDQGRAAEGVAETSRAFASATGDAQITWLHGKALLAAGRAPEAVRVLTPLRTAPPSGIVVERLLAPALASAGDVEGSIRVSQEAIAARPDDVGLRFNLAVTYANSNRLDEARAELKTILEKAPQHPGATSLLNSLNAPGP